MNRKEIKEEAKKKIVGNKWKLIWPVLLVGLVIGIIEGILGNIAGVETATVEVSEEALEGKNAFEAFMIGFKDGMAEATPTPVWYELVMALISLVEAVFMVGYVKYVLNIVRTGEAKFNDIVDFFKTNWSRVLITSVVSGLIVFGLTLLLVIPGIIKALAFAMIDYLLVDTELSPKEVRNKSQSMMNGYKWDYVVFNLSFIGWILLVPFTLGILLVWLFPYMTVAQALYYEKLKEING